MRPVLLFGFSIERVNEYQTRKINVSAFIGKQVPNFSGGRDREAITPV